MKYKPGTLSALLKLYWSETFPLKQPVGKTADATVLKYDEYYYRGSLLA